MHCLNLSIALNPMKPNYRRTLTTLGVGLTVGISLLVTKTLLWPMDSTAQTCTKVPQKDVTARLDLLGMPFKTGKYAKSQPYARNVWVMYPFQNKVYLGHGDSNSNRGPIPLWFFNLKSRRFKFQFVAPEEQIRDFQAIGSTLYTPGIDARGNWKFGNFYRLKKKGWQKVRTLPGGVHVWSIQGFQRQLWSVIRRQDSHGYLLRSGDGGRSWQDVQVLRADPAQLVRFETSLYVFGGGRPWQVDATLKPIQRQDLDLPTLFPNHSQATLVTKAVAYQSQLAYLSNVPRFASSTSQNTKVLNSEDPHLQPPGLFAAQSLKPNNTKVQRIQLEANEVPWDLLASKQGLYVLTSERQNVSGKQRFVNRVRKAMDQNHWCEILTFESETFARSFTQLQGHWYFGLGTDYGEKYGRKSYTQRAHPQSGTILRTQI